MLSLLYQQFPEICARMLPLMSNIFSLNLSATCQEMPDIYLYGQLFDYLFPNICKVVSSNVNKSHAVAEKPRDATLNSDPHVGNTINSTCVRLRIYCTMYLTLRYITLRYVTYLIIVN